MLLWQAGRPGDDRESYRLAQAIFQKLADTNPAVTYFRSQLAWTHNNIGYSQSLTGKPDQASESYRRAQEIFQKLADDNPSATDFQRALAHTLDNIGNLRSGMGKTDEALESYRRALEIQQKLALANPNATDFQAAIAGSYLRIGWLLFQIGELGKSMDYFALEEPIWKRLADANPTVPEYQNSLANCHTNITNVLLRKARPAEARARSERAVALREVMGESAVLDDPVVDGAGVDADSNGGGPPLDLECRPERVMMLRHTDPAFARGAKSMHRHHLVGVIHAQVAVERDPNRHPSSTS